ncbi:MAG TPA: hypothetical protein VF049_14640 [Nocardioidaceae bacterium]|jgi:hypothetical protein
MIDAYDVELQDAELVDEIRLIGELMVAASESPRPLSQADIDAILWN